MEMQYRKTRYKISGIISKHREELNRTDIQFFHSYMGGKRDSNFYLLMKFHKPTLKTRDIIDKKYTVLGPVSIRVDH